MGRKVARVTKTSRIVRVTARSQQVLARDPAYAMAWPCEPKSTLGDCTPLQLLATKSGAFAVGELMIAIEHGVFV
jgi:uncharacterized protein (DUF2384 family)